MRIDNISTKYFSSRQEAMELVLALSEADDELEYIVEERGEYFVVVAYDEDGVVGEL